MIAQRQRQCVTVSDWLQYDDGTMTAPAHFSWLETVRALCRPSPAPPALVRTGGLLLALSLAAVLVLAILGYVWHDNSHRYFGERKVGTYLSFLNLLATGALSASIAQRLGPRDFARFWWVAAVGFVWLGCDDLFTLHERIDRGLHALFRLDPDHPITDHLDDLIVASYGMAALALAYRHRMDLWPLTWMHRTLGSAFVLFGAMVVADFFYWSKTLEDGLKVVAGTLIFVGFLAARLELGWAAEHQSSTLVEGDDARGADDRHREAEHESPPSATRALGR
jgi:hypothetical protein